MQNLKKLTENHKSSAPHVERINSVKTDSHGKEGEADGVQLTQDLSQDQRQQLLSVVKDATTRIKSLHEFIINNKSGIGNSVKYWVTLYNANGIVV